MRGYSHDSVLSIVDVVRHKLVGHHVTFDMSRGSVSATSAVLDALVVVASPKEGNLAVGHELAHHVEGSVGALIKGNVPMLGPQSFAIDPVRVGNDVASRKDIFICRL